MPTDLPTTVSWSNAVVLNKGYYHGIVFDIPGAEVLIDGQWIAFSDKNASLIKAQNPMNLQWRINGDLLRKLGYKKGDTVTGHMLVVDDQWNGLTITKDISVKVTE